MSTATEAGTVVGNLPACPAWCARDHDKLGREQEITHVGLRAPLPGVETGDGQMRDLVVELAAFEGIEDTQIVRGPVRVRLNDEDGGFYLTAQQARVLGAALTTAGRQADEVSE